MNHSTITTDEVLLSSLDPLETTVPSLDTQTAAQHKLHARYTDQRRRNWHALEHSHNPQLRKRATKLTQCCRFPRAMVLGNGQPGLSLNRCKDRCCPRCSTQRGRELSIKIAEHTRRMNSPRLITLTVASEPGTPLVTLIEHLRSSFRKLRKQPLWKTKVKGGVYTLEVTRNAESGAWHPHLHIIADGQYWDQNSISHAWFEATENSKIVDVRKIHSAQGTAKYVADYVAKPWAHSDWSDDEICEWAEAMHRQRLAHTFGNMHAKAVEESDETDEVRSCDDLGSTLWIKTASNRGHRVASRIVEMVKAWGQSWRGAFGIAEEEKVEREVDASERAEFVMLCESMRAEWFREEQQKPPPTRSAADPYLFAIHDAHAIRRR